MPRNWKGIGIKDNGQMPTGVPPAVICPWTLPRAKKHATGMFFCLAALGRPLRVLSPPQIEKERRPEGLLSFSGVGDGTRLHFRLWRKLRFGSVKPSPATVRRTVAFRLFESPSFGK